MKSDSAQSLKEEFECLIAKYDLKTFMFLIVGEESDSSLYGVTKSNIDDSGSPSDSQQKTMCLFEIMVERAVMDAQKMLGLRVLPAIGLLQGVLDELAVTHIGANSNAELGDSKWKSALQNATILMPSPTGDIEN